MKKMFVKLFNSRILSLIAGLLLFIIVRNISVIGRVFKAAFEFAKMVLFTIGNFITNSLAGMGVLSKSILLAICLLLIYELLKQLFTRTSISQYKYVTKVNNFIVNSKNYINDSKALSNICGLAKALIILVALFSLIL